MIIEDYKIVICCFSAKHAALRSKSEDLLAWNRVNVSKWIDMSSRGLLFQWDITIGVQNVVQSEPHHHLM